MLADWPSIRAHDYLRRHDIRYDRTVYVELRFFLLLSQPQSMAHVDLAIEHGQTPEAARANFEQAISTVQTRFGKWVHGVEWADDRSSVKLAGTGFSVDLTYDNKNVYVRGTVPIAFKLMERPVRTFIAHALAGKE
jgi:hypothetical protein